MFVYYEELIVELMNACVSEQTNQNIYKALSSVSESKVRGSRHCLRVRRDIANCAGALLLNGFR